MERESFECPETAAIMNENFINIKVWGRCGECLQLVIGDSLHMMVCVQRHMWGFFGCCH